MQEGPRGAPTALDGGGGDAHHSGGLFDRQAGEEAQFDQLGLPGVERRQFPEGHVQQDHVDGPLLADDHGVFEQDFLIVATAARGAMLARVVEQDAAHLSGGHRHEVTAAFERGALVHHADVGFVHEGRGLHGVLTALTTEVGTSEAVQFVIDQGQEVVDGLPLAASDLSE